MHPHLLRNVSVPQDPVLLQKMVFGLTLELWRSIVELEEGRRQEKSLQCSTERGSAG